LSSQIKPTTPVDGQVLKRLMEAALIWLRTNQQTVNALNVFPVPDGDTGTNMVLTMQAAYDEIAHSTERNAGKVAHAIAHGALMGARGNSGVILSQIWRGFARGLDSQEVMDGPTLVKALAIGRDTAYKGVVRPVEGTILTVVKDIAAAAEAIQAETDNPYAILEALIPAAAQSVLRTPELLPVLKDAGVVDSGGKGLFFIFEGMLRLVHGQSLETAVMTVQPLGAMMLENALETIEPGQEFEVVVDFRPSKTLDLEQFYADLEKIGTSIQVGEGDGMYRMHIHVTTEKRYEPIDYTMSLGTITKVAMENLLAQMGTDAPMQTRAELELAQLEPGQIGVVAVAPGLGIARVFASLGVAAVVSGGQTMNPSTQEILEAFTDLPTDKIIILPNNKNIILAAQAAVQAAEQLGIQKQIAIIPSRTVPQGLAAMLRLVPDGSMEDVTADMLTALTEVQTGEITTATRSVELDGVMVEEGQIIALYNGKLVLSAETVEQATLGLLEIAHAEDWELITLFSGENFSGLELDHIAATIRAAYPGQEVEVQVGGQPYYHLIISIE